MERITIKKTVGKIGPGSINTTSAPAQERTLAGSSRRFLLTAELQGYLGKEGKMRQDRVVRGREEEGREAQKRRRALFFFSVKLKPFTDLCVPQPGSLQAPKASTAR